MKKQIINQKDKKNNMYRRCHSAGMFYTSSAGAVTSLILWMGNQITLLRDGVPRARRYGARTPRYLSRNLRSALNSVILIALASVPLLLSNNTYAASSTLSLSVSNNVVDLNIIPTGANGSFAKSGNTTITASTDNATGYTLSIAASSSTDYNKLINSSDSNTSTNYLSSVTEATTESAFKSLTATTYNGKWGYLPSKYCTGDGGSTCTTNTDFLPAPPASGDILDVTSAANSTANSYTLAIGARVDGSIKMGSYSNTYNVILVANAIPYTITYNDGVVSSMPVDVDSTSSASTVTLSNNTPTRAGYTFLGWCTVQVADGASCSGTTYQPGGTYTLDQTGGSNNLNLYAMWSKNSKTSISDLTYMQDFASLTPAERARVKASMTTNTSYQLTDSRDGTKYWITKLQTASSNPRSIDGYQIWMTQNLDLDLSTSKTLSSEDTDLTACTSGIYSAGYTMSGGTCYWTPSESTATSMSATTSTTTPQSYNPGNVYYYQNQSASTTCTTANECLHWHIGNYYNWSAVVASNNSSSQTANYIYAGNSICPAGWRVPTSLTSASGYSDFNYLLVQQGIAVNYVGVTTNATWATNGYSKIQGAPLYIVRSGYNNGSSLSLAASYGYLWSGSSVSSTHAYNIHYASSHVYPAAGDGDRFTRLPVRCLVRE